MPHRGAGVRWPVGEWRYPVSLPVRAKSACPDGVVANPLIPGR